MLSIRSPIPLNTTTIAHAARMAAFMGSRWLSIPALQKAIVFETHGGPLIYKDIPVPKPRSNEILVNVKFSGVCHTDLHAWKGDLDIPGKLPLVGGHEGAGVVVGLGENVKGWKIGDYAGIKWLNGSCQLCSICETGNESNCDDAELSGYTRDGTFQQYATADAIQAARLPPGTDLAKAAPILCAGITVYKALKTAHVKPGDWVAISGAGGGLGTLAIQYAKAMGLMVVAIDGGADKGKLVKELGADHYVDFKTDDVVKSVLEITNGGAHGVLNVSVSELAMSQSAEYVRKLGTVVLVGLPKGAKFTIPVLDAVAKSVNIAGSYVGNRSDSREAIEFFTRGLVHSPIKLAGLTDIPRIFKEMEQGKVLGRYVVDTAK